MNFVHSAGRCPPGITNEWCLRVRENPIIKYLKWTASFPANYAVHNVKFPQASNISFYNPESRGLPRLVPFRSIVATCNQYHQFSHSHITWCDLKVWIHFCNENMALICLNWLEVNKSSPVQWQRLNIEVLGFIFPKPCKFLKAHILRASSTEADLTVCQVWSESEILDVLVSGARPCIEKWPKSKFLQSLSYSQG